MSRWSSTSLAEDTTKSHCTSRESVTAASPIASTNGTLPAPAAGAVWTLPAAAVGSTCGSTARTKQLHSTLAGLRTAGVAPRAAKEAADVIAPALPPPPARYNRAPAGCRARTCGVWRAPRAPAPLPWPSAARAKQTTSRLARARARRGAAIRTHARPPGENACVPRSAIETKRNRQTNKYRKPRQRANSKHSNQRSNTAKGTGARRGAAPHRAHAAGCRTRAPAVGVPGRARRVGVGVGGAAPHRARLPPCEGVVPGRPRRTGEGRRGRPGGDPPGS